MRLDNFAIASILRAPMESIEAIVSFDLATIIDERIAFYRTVIILLHGLYL